MRNGVKEPHSLTTKPSEHSNALFRQMQRGLTVKDLLLLLNNLLRILRALTVGGLTISRRAHAHASTLSVSLGNATKEQEYLVSDKLCEPVNIFHSSLYELTALQIWKELEEVLTKSSNSMRGLLKSMCGVNEIHHMILPFAKESSLNDITSRCESLLKRRQCVQEKTIV